MMSERLIPFKHDEKKRERSGSPKKRRRNSEPRETKVSCARSMWSQASCSSSRALGGSRGDRRLDPYLNVEEHSGRIRGKKQEDGCPMGGRKGHRVLDNGSEACRKKLKGAGVRELKLKAIDLKGGTR